MGILGHSMGAAGARRGRRGPGRRGGRRGGHPGDPYRLTRQTFRLAGLPIPGPIAWPLAWLTTRVYLRPRGHTIASVSATRAVRGIAGPVLLVHGSDDGVVPVGHLASSLARAARPRRPTR